MIDFVKI